MTAIYYEDLVVGQTFASDVYTLSEEEIITFAQQYDPQVFHTDSEGAKSSIFYGLVASGWHTTAAMMRLMIDSLPLEHGLKGLGVDVKWLKAVKANDSLHIVTEVMGLYPIKDKQDRGRVNLLITAWNQDDEEVCTIDAQVLWYGRDYQPAIIITN